jgi:hypothetical protein
LIFFDQVHDDILLGISLYEDLAVIEILLLITALGTNGDVGKPKL